MPDLKKGLPNRKPPSTIEVAYDAEIDNVKKAVAKLCGVKDYNRIGLFYPSTRKRIADRRALVREQEDVTKTGEILVQDLGMLPTQQTSPSFPASL